MNIVLVCEPPRTILPEGFVYVGQDCYGLTSSDAGAPRYLYSDSATSCVILVLEGTGRDRRPLVALTHLSCDRRFRAFFDLVDRHFAGPVSVFALGAYPPSAESSQRNSRIVLHWILTHFSFQQDHGTAPNDWYLDQIRLALGIHVSGKDWNGCAGIDVQTGNVSTQSYALTETQRDPTGGVQTLFSVFGVQATPPLLLHNSGEAFRENEVMQLVAQAEGANWPAILGMTDTQILARCSSTPDHEVPWFCEGLRTSARYVKNYTARITKILSP